MQHRARIRRAAERPQHRRNDPPAPTVAPPPDAGGVPSVAADFSIATLSVLPEVTPVARKIQRQENDDRHPVPVPTPAPPATPPGDDAEQLKAGGEGSTTLLAPTVSFKVYSGKTLQDVSNALPKEAGSFTFDIGTATDGDPITRATVTVKQAIELPRWAERDVQCKPIQAAWDRFASALRQHEDEHVKINQQQLGTAHTHYVGKAKSETPDVTTELENDANAAGQAFDAQTGNGTTGNPPTIIDVGAKCSDKGTFEDFGPNGEELQAKLEVSEPGDPDEEEADRVAEQVMRMADPRERAPLRLVSSGGVVQRCAACEAEEKKWQAAPEGQRVRRKCAECEAKEQALEAEEAEKKRRVARKEANGRSSVTASPRVVDVTRSGGQPLDAETRAFMEPRFAYDFGRVRIHADGEAAIAARSVNAQAYTLGDRVVFSAGRYAPGTSEGRRLIAHELTHIVQQDGANAYVQREPAAASAEETPVQKAIRTNDPADAKAITSWTGVSVDDRFKVIRVLAYQGWVGPLDEYKIEEIWRTIPKSDLPTIATREIVLWNHCIDVGAELEKLPAVKEIRGSFVQDIRTLAGDYLWKNKKFVEEQMANAGLPTTEGQTAPPPTEDQARKMDKMREAAASVANNQAEQERARKINVGYDPKKVKGGLGEIYDKYYPATFNPHRRPELETKPSVMQTTLIVDITPYDQVKAAYDRSAKATQDVLTVHPMLYAISREGKSDVTGAFSKLTDPAAARAALAGGMRKLLADIQKTDDLVRASATFPLDLVPLQEQLFAGKKPSHPEVEDWSLSFTRQIGKEVKGEHDFANALDAMGLQFASGAAFLLAPLTSGASLAALLAVGVGAAGIKAYNSAEQYDNLLQASKTAAVPGTGLVSDAQVDEAKATMEADQAALALGVITAAALGAAGVVRWIAGRRSGEVTSPPDVGENRKVKTDAEAFVQARNARNTMQAAYDEMPKARRDQVAAITGGVNVETGQVAGGYNTAGQCAEDMVVQRLGGDASKVRFSEAVRPRTGLQQPVCLRCQGKYAPNQFPEGVIFAGSSPPGGSSTP